MDKKPIQTDSRNSNGDVVLTRNADRTTNGAAWQTSIQNHLLISHSRIKAAFDAGQDCVRRPDIDRDAWLYPPIAADPLAIPPIAAFAGRLKYPLGPDGYPTVDSDSKIQKDQETLDKHRLQESADNEKCMQRILLTLPHALQEEIQEKDSEFIVFTSNYQVFSLVMCIREALTLSSANNALALIQRVMNPIFPIGSSTSLTHDAHVIRQNAEQLLQQFPVGATARDVIHGFALAGLLGKLDPVFFGDFLSNYNRLYPSGLGPTLSETTTRLITYTETMSPASADFKKQQSDEFRAHTQEQEIYGLLSKIIAEPQGPQVLAATIVKHPQKAKLMALLSSHLKPSAPKATPDSTSPSSVPLASQLCSDCKVSFVPSTAFHKRCLSCQRKVAKKERAAAAIADATDVPPAGAVALAAKYAIAVSNAPASLAASNAPASSCLAPIATPPGYWDNGSSVHTTCDFSNILNVEPLDKPFFIGGFGSGLKAIAKGFHPSLPDGLNTIYHTPNSNLTLFSIGHMVRRGCSTSQKNCILTVTDPVGVTLDTSAMLANNLCPISPSILGYDPEDPLAPVSTGLYFAAFKDGWSPFMEDTFKPLVLAYHASAEPETFFTPEMILRCNAVQDLHNTHAHVTDAVLGVALDNGVLVSPLRLTSHDVAMNRVYRLNLPCPECAEANLKHPSYPASTNLPATGVGETISLDLEKLPEPSSPGGFTHQLMAVDELTGTIGLIGCTSKTAPDVFYAFMKYLNKNYKAYGHTTRKLTADAEAIFTALIPLFGSAGMSLTQFPPQQHAQRLERHQQTLLNKYQATKAMIPMFLPNKFEHVLKNAVAFAMSTVPNTNTGVRSPYELRTGHRFPQHAEHGNIKIGDTCMVYSGSDVRSKRAKRNAQTKQSTPHSELGICMGFSETTLGSYQFLVQSGAIEPRRILKKVAVSNPFGYPDRPVYVARTAASRARGTKQPAPAVHATIPPLPAVSPSFLVPLDAPFVLPPGPEPTVVAILSHDLDIPNRKATEYRVQYSDGDIVYHHRPQLRNDPVFQVYEREHFPTVPKSAASKPTVAKVTKPAIKPLAPQSGSQSASVSVTTPRRSVRFLSVAADASDPNQSPFTLVASGPAATVAPVKSPLCLPPTLDFLVDDDDLPDVDFALKPSPKLPAPPSNDLSWYDPVASPLSAAERHLDLAPPATTGSLPSILHSALMPIQHNLSHKQAFAFDPIAAQSASDIEMNKYFGTKATGGYAVCDLSKPLRYSDLPAGALLQNNYMFWKTKYDAAGKFKKFGSRCYTMGKDQPAATYHSTYAGTCATEDLLVLLAGVIAFTNSLALPLDFFKFDVTGAFLQGRLTPENTPQRCFIRFAPDIPHPCAGKIYERFSGTYGSKDANAIFDEDLTKTMAQAGFYPNPVSPKIFSRFDEEDVTKFCHVPMHVDDGLGACTHQPFKDELRRILEAHYGPLDWEDDVTSHIGLHFQRFTDGSLTLDQHGYELRMLQDLGATALPPVDRPSLSDFFDAPTDTTLVNQHQFRLIIGKLVYLLTTWPKLRKEIVYLSTRQGKATQSCMSKAIRVLAYVNAHRYNYIRFSGTDTQVYFWVDASPNVHPSGHGHGGNFITIGATSGAVSAHSAIQNDCLAQGAWEAEYVELPFAAKKAVHFRRLLHSLGIPQTEPITAYEDNSSVINLAIAPAVTTKSKHIHARYHLIRDYVNQKMVKMVKVPGADNPADLYTKTLATPLTARYGDRIHNVSQTPLVPIVPAGVGGSVKK